MKYCNKVISKRFGLGHTNDFWQQYNLSFGKKKSWNLPARNKIEKATCYELQKLFSPLIIFKHEKCQIINSFLWKSNFNKQALTSLERKKKKSSSMRLCILLSMLRRQRVVFFSLAMSKNGLDWAKSNIATPDPPVFIDRRLWSIFWIITVYHSALQRLCHTWWLFECYLKIYSPVRGVSSVSAISAH